VDLHTVRHLVQHGKTLPFCAPVDNDERPLDP
jgi:hypothetical protein